MDNSRDKLEADYLIGILNKSIINADMSNSSKIKALTPFIYKKKWQTAKTQPTSKALTIVIDMIHGYISQYKFDDEVNLMPTRLARIEKLMSGSTKSFWMERNAKLSDASIDKILIHIHGHLEHLLDREELEKSSRETQSNEQQKGNVKFEAILRKEESLRAKSRLEQQKIQENNREMKQREELNKNNSPIVATVLEPSSLSEEQLANLRKAQRSDHEQEEETTSCHGIQCPFMGGNQSRKTRRIRKTKKYKKRKTRKPTKKRKTRKTTKKHNTKGGKKNKRKKTN